MTTYRITTDERDSHLLAPHRVGQQVGIPVRKVGGSVWTTKVVPGTITTVDGLTSEAEYVLPEGYEAT
jgi:hypothetical protein